MTTMRIHCLQHVDFEGPAFLPVWARGAGHRWTRTLVPEADGLPDPGDWDVLIILGGPMGVGDHSTHPWLAAEKAWLGEQLAADRPVLGICLGAQLIAEALGARVAPGPHREIGWYTAERATEIRDHWLAEVLPSRFETFFWHGDVFDIPRGALPVAGTPGCSNQGFLHGNSLGLQFHLEVTPEWARHLASRDAGQLVADTWVQTADQILSRPPELCERNNRLLGGLLDRWLREIRRAGGTSLRGDRNFLA